MGIESRSENHRIILTVTGPFLESQWSDFKEVIQEAYTLKPRQVIIDLTHCTAIDSQSAGFLIVSHKQSSLEHLAFGIVAPSARLDHLLFKALPIRETTFPIFSSLEEALQDPCFPLL